MRSQGISSRSIGCVHSDPDTLFVYACVGESGRLFDRRDSGQSSIAPLRNTEVQPSCFSLASCGGSTWSLVVFASPMSADRSRGNYKSQVIDARKGATGSAQRNRSIRRFHRLRRLLCGQFVRGVAARARSCAFF
jgi:hypothetical protein